MTYAAALFHFRQYLTVPWRPHSLTKTIDVGSYTIHGMKSTFLSWGSQLSQRGVVSTEDGSRDTTNQFMLQSAFTAGTTSMPKSVFIIQHRGGQLRTLEPAVAMEAFRKELQQYEFTTIQIQPNCGGLQMTDH